MQAVFKYLNLNNYIRFIKNRLMNINFKINRTFVASTIVSNKEIFFTISSEKEYYMRLQQSYTAEKSTMEWIEKIIDYDDIVYDIGANVGAYSLLIGKYMQDNKRGGQVYSFEPESQNFASLNKNIILNNLSNYLLPINLAFGEKLDVGKFYLSSNIVGSATHALNAPISDGVEFHPTHTQGVISMSLNEFIELKNVKFPNHIKIDVDGLEALIVNNMTSILEDKRLKSICIEIADKLSKGDIEGKIISYKFKETIREEWNSENGKIINIIFERE